MTRIPPRPLCLVAAVLLPGIALLVALAVAPPAASARERARVLVPPDLLRLDDGDSVAIRWPKGEEQVRLLGIDTPEVLHLDHDIPYAQPFGDAAAAFLRGCVAVADRIELLRSGETDRYGRTLGYLFVNGRNYSVLAIEARFSRGPSDRFGDNGLPEEHAACKAAAKRAGPVPFEEPYLYRRRMRDVSSWLKERGLYPKIEREDAAGK